MKNFSEKKMYGGSSSGFMEDYVYEDSEESIAYRVISQTSDLNLFFDVMASGLIHDVNESYHNNTLLSVVYDKKSGSLSDESFEGIEEETDFKKISEHFKNVRRHWHAATTILIAAGADPWIDFKRVIDPSIAGKIFDADNQEIDCVFNTLFGKALFSDDHNMMKLLFRHPSKPTVDQINKAFVRHNYRSYYNNNRKRNDVEAFGIMNYAARRCSPKMIKVLAENGFDVNVRDDNGRTPAYFSSSPEVMNALIESGARVDNIDNDGETVMSVVDDGNWTGVIKSEFRKIIIDKMKSTMTDEQVREIQIPELLKIVQRGTKTELEAMLRKLKVKSNFTVDLGRNGVRSILTQALLKAAPFWTEETHRGSGSVSGVFIKMVMANNKEDLFRKPWTDRPNIDHAALSALSYTAVSSDDKLPVKDSDNVKIMAQRYSSLPKNEKMNRFLDDVFDVAKILSESANSSEKVSFARWVAMMPCVVKNIGLVKGVYNNRDMCYNGTDDVAAESSDMIVMLKEIMPDGDVDLNYFSKKMVEFLEFQADVVSKNLKSSEFITDSICNEGLRKTRYNVLAQTYCINALKNEILNGDNDNHCALAVIAMSNSIPGNYTYHSDEVYNKMKDAFKDALSCINAKNINFNQESLDSINKISENLKNDERANPLRDTVDAMVSKFNLLKVAGDNLSSNVMKKRMM